MIRKNLFAEITPYRTGRLKVSPVHEIYYEESGVPDGLPVLIIHGGPGGGSAPVMRRYHDPKRYRIIIFDQRGCGRSTPHATLEDNTTWDLVADMERLREHLGIARWQLFGGSWGACLALAYAQTHPERVSAMVLRGIFTLRRAELEWFYQEGGASWLFPDAYESFAAPIPSAERGDMIAAYYRRLTGPDPHERLIAARAWSLWEGRLLTLLHNPSQLEKFTVDDYALAFARIEAHYFVHCGFFERDDQLLSGMDRVAHLPGVIVQGRYDLVTPMRTAWELARAWPRAELRIVPDAGHAMSEPGIIDELIRATETFSESDSI